MSLGKEIARFAQLAGSNGFERTYLVSLWECGSTLIRDHSINSGEPTNMWRRARGWQEKFKSLEEARAYYLKRGHKERSGGSTGALVAETSTKGIKRVSNDEHT